MTRNLLLFSCCLLAYPHTSTIECGNVQEAKPVKAVTEENGITMSASMPAKSVAGGAVMLKVTVENKSKKEARFFARGDYWDYDLEMFDSKGRKVPHTQFGKYVYGSARSMVESALYERFASGGKIESTHSDERLHGGRQRAWSVGRHGTLGLVGADDACGG